jgi:uroporphyrinogen-III synthase
MVGLTGNIREDGLLVVQSVVHSFQGLSNEQEEALYKADEPPVMPQRKRGIRPVLLYDLEIRGYLFEEVERPLTQTEMIEAIYEKMYGVL